MEGTLRIALLAMLEPADAGHPHPRGSLRVAGASLAQHQLGIASVLDCQRVICAVRGPSPDLLSLQYAVEDAGLLFNSVTGAQQLSGLVTASDELVVIAEGLFVEPDRVAPLLGSGRPVVLALPDDAVAQGFERLDINHAAAGLLRIPGALVERLHELPPDCDAASALTRIALQAGAQLREVPAEIRASGWRLVRDDVEARAVENDWLRSRFAGGGSPAPSVRLARAGVLSFGASLLHAGNASDMLGIASVVVSALAVGSAWFGLVVPAFLLAALAWLVVQAAGLLRGAERHAFNVAPPAIPRADALGWLVDSALIAIMVLGLAASATQAPISLEYRLFPAFILILLVHLVSRMLADRLAAWTGDRMVLAVLLAAAVALGYLGLTIRVFAVALALAGLILPPRRPD